MFYIALFKPDFSLTFIFQIIIFYFFSLFSTAYGYLVNDLSDVDLDKLHGKSNVFIKVTSSFCKYYVLVALLLSVAFAVPFFQKSAFLLIWVTWLFLSTFYSLEPIRLKTRGVLNIISIVLAQRVLPILLLFAAFSFWQIADVAIIFVYVFLRGLSSDLNHQLSDYELDRTTETETFVQRIGRHKSHKIFQLSLECEKLGLLIIMIKLAFHVKDLYSGYIVWIMVLALMLYIVSYFYGLYLIMRGEKQNPFLEKEKNIFQFLHHAFPTVLLPVFLCASMLKLNLAYFFLLLIIIINQRLYKPMIWSNSYPVLLFNKLKARM